MDGAPSIHSVWAPSERDTFTRVIKKIYKRQDVVDAKLLRSAFKVWLGQAHESRKANAEVEQRARVVDIMKNSERGKRSTMEKEAIRRFVVSHCSCIPKQISFSEMDALCNELDWVPYVGRSILFLQGDFGNVYYIVGAGIVSLYLESSKDREMEIAREFGTQRGHPFEGTKEDLDALGKNIVNLPPGAGFGEYAILATTNKIRSCAAVASAPDTLLFIMHADTYNKVLRQHHYRQKQLQSATALLKDLPLFKHNTYSQLATAAYTMKNQTYSANSPLLRCGQSILSVQLIVSGQVKMFAPRDVTRKSSFGASSGSEKTRKASVSATGAALTALLSTNTAAETQQQHGSAKFGNTYALSLLSTAGASTATGGSGGGGGGETNGVVSSGGRAISPRRFADRAMERRMPRLAVAILGRGQILGEMEIQKGSDVFELDYVSGEAGVELLEMPLNVYRERTGVGLATDDSANGRAAMNAAALAGGFRRGPNVQKAIAAINEDKEELRIGRLSRAYDAMAQMMGANATEIKNRNELMVALPVIIDTSYTSATAAAASAAANTQFNSQITYATYGGSSSPRSSSSPRKASSLLHHSPTNKYNNNSGGGGGGGVVGGGGPVLLRSVGHSTYSPDAPTVHRRPSELLSGPPPGRSYESPVSPRSRNGTRKYNRFGASIVSGTGSSIAAGISGGGGGSSVVRGAERVAPGGMKRSGVNASPRSTPAYARG